MAEWVTRKERKNGEILKCDINLFIRRLITAGKTAPQEDYEEYSKCVSVSVWVHSRKVEDFRTADDLVVEKKFD
ncbi:hypothetical protein RUM43_001226 [Polyplax serrata]|uniref:Uncharacterized protein n=1 Tax=Polyplax serrata TaxID=468196 RepID=A0AAN8XQB3_POLSC